ncbi:armadillo-type protein [Trichoderma evansii]
MAYNRGVSLTQIHPSPGVDAKTDIDIIAIHGLDTKSPDTWVSKSSYPAEDVNWLACPRMLPERIGPARIFTCDWPADLLEQPDLIQKTAEEFARLLLAGIKRRPLPKNSGYAKGKDRPIVFIASCLGGIILIKALVIAGHSSSEYTAVRRSTRGIVFLATPFRGTSFQDVADWAEPGLRAWASIRGQKVSNLLGDVKGSTFHLEELVRSFTQLCQDKNYPCQVITFYELGLTSLHRKFPLSWLIPSGVLNLVVPPKPLVNSSSATLDIVTDPLPLNRRHVMMNKFNGLEDPDFQCVVGKIEEILRNIRTKSPLDDADAWIRNKHYDVDRLKIERLSGGLLPMDQCYINLAVVEQRDQDSERPKARDAKSSPFSIFNRQKIETPDTAVQVELATIFNQRQGRNEEMIQPRRILVRGRAGVGKTTLCKKIVHEFTQGTWSEWNNLFDRVLWVPLRNLKLEERRQQPAYDFEALLTHEFFSLPNNKPDFAKHLALSLETNSSKTLFLLDGLDEISQDLAGNNSMSRFLNELLEQPNLIVTSRPSGRLPLKLDLELEAIGFYPDQVKEYIKKTFTNPKTTEIDEKTVDNIQSFLRDHWLIQGLVRIPIQLDALCYSWKDIRSDMPETMTALYQAIEFSLWKKDIVRLEKTYNHSPVTLYHFQDASRQRVEEFVTDEISFLESLAFAGLHSDIIEFEPKHLNFISDRFSALLLGKVAPSLSFLRNSNPSSEDCNRSYHFIHLTFQEYFAARHFVRQWTAREPLYCVEFSGKKINKTDPIKFLQKHKYTARYGILWRFVAGLLEAEPEEISLFFQKIEEEPLDLLGPAHQRLVMHCLSEVSSNLPIRIDIEQRLSKWLLFECEFTKGNRSHLAREVEFPEQALETTFLKGSDNIKLKILRSITKRATVPVSIINQAVSWLGQVDQGVRNAALMALKQLALPGGILQAIAAQLKDENWNVREFTAAVLVQRLALPIDILQVVAARLEDESWIVRQVTVKALGRRLTLPNEILQAVAARLEDESWSIRQVTVVALGQRLTLPNEILQAVAARLEDENWIVRQVTVQALGRRLTLPNEILQAVAARLEDESWIAREVTVAALGQRLALPNGILQAVAARLEDKDRSVQQAAFRALRRQLSLSDETIKTIAAQFKDNENSSIQAATIEALGSRSNLSNEILQAIAANLKEYGNSFIQVAAMEALCEQSNVPDEILKGIATQLKDNKDDPSFKTAAIRALGKQPDLSNEILNILAAQLKDDNRDNQVDAIEALGKQSSLPNEFLNVIAAQLGHNNWSIQLTAIVALGNQSGLSNDILNAIAAQLEYKDQIIQQATIKALDNQLSLPSKILNAIAARVDHDEFPSAHAETMLRKRKEFYPTLLEGPYGPSLYKVLLRRSFREELSWCIDDDGNSFINIPGDGGGTLIDKKCDMKAIIKEVRPANFPA